MSAVHTPKPPRAVASKQHAKERYRTVRETSERICRPLATEDYVVQTMDDVSPPKWHLAHASWFFETFLLIERQPNYSPFHPEYGFLFNSYYEAVGERHPRPRRGLLSRPTVKQVYSYRAHVDEAMFRLIDQASDDTFDRLAPLIELGLHHEQQHQELLVTDIKHILAQNPLRPAYHSAHSTSLPADQAAEPAASGSGRHSINQANGSQRESGAGDADSAEQWIPYPGGITEIGHDGEGFAYDNEGPRHKVYLQPFRLASRPVSNGEYLEFVEAGGYRDPRYWLSEGWAVILEKGWEAPLYWELDDGDARYMTLSGMRSIDADEPVCHLSYYEASAYAAWRGKRLPTEWEWETAAVDASRDGNFLDHRRLHPAPAARDADTPVQIFGDVWEWTQSAYSPYPGFRPAEGAVGEYNGKFMCNQFVLRGGSCATPQDHIRVTYRNFFPPDARWQFTGLRLADD